VRFVALSCNLSVSAVVSLLNFCCVDIFNVSAYILDPAFPKNNHFNPTVLRLCDIVIYFSFKTSVMLIFIRIVMSIKVCVYNEM